MQTPFEIDNENKITKKENPFLSSSNLPQENKPNIPLTSSFLTTHSFPDLPKDQNPFLVKPKLNQEVLDPSHPKPTNSKDNPFLAKPNISHDTVSPFKFGANPNSTAAEKVADNPFITKPKISNETVTPFTFSSNSNSIITEDRTSKLHKKELISKITNKGGDKKIKSESFQPFILPTIMLNSPDAYKPVQTYKKTSENTTKNQLIEKKNTNEGLKPSIQPNIILNSPGLFQKPPNYPQTSEYSSFNPTPQKEFLVSPEFMKNHPNFFASPINLTEFPSPFITDSNFQTPNIAKHVPQVPPEPEVKNENENIVNRLTERAFDNLVESFLSTSFFTEFVASNSVEKAENEVKFYINDISKQESNTINELKRQVSIKRYELEEKKKVNKSISKKYEEVDKEVKKIMETTEVFRVKHSEYERKIKRSSKTYSQVLLPEFEDKERELHMLGGNKNNITKILDKIQQENHELSRRINNKKKDLSEIKKKKAELGDEISKLEELNQSLRQEMQAVKPKNHEISLECSWVKYKNKEKKKRLKFYEEDIKRVKKEINGLRAGIETVTQDSLVQNEKLNQLEKMIEAKIQPKNIKKHFLGPSVQETDMIDTTRPDKSEGIEKFKLRKEEHHPASVNQPKEDLIKLLTFLLILLTIILIFK